MRSRRSLTTVFALTLALCAIGTPATAQGPGEQDSPRRGATVVRVSEPDEFDWADAGVGVAGGVALSILGIALVLLVSDRRRRPSTRSSARPST